MFPHLLSLPSLCEIVSLFEKRSVKPHLHNPHTVLGFIFCLEFVDTRRCACWRDIFNKNIITQTFALRAHLKQARRKAPPTTPPWAGVYLAQCFLNLKLARRKAPPTKSTQPWAGVYLAQCFLNLKQARRKAPPTTPPVGGSLPRAMFFKP